MTDQIIQYISIITTCVITLASVVGTCVGTIKSIKSAFKTKEDVAAKQNKELLTRLNEVVAENAEIKSLLIQEKNARLNIIEAKKDVKESKKLHR